MRKQLVAIGVVVAAMIVATVLALRAGQPPAEAPHPQLDALLTQCDAGGSSLATMYDKVSEPLRSTADPAKRLAAARGQVANVIDGRLATCERALAVAQHDRRGSAVMAVGPFVERLEAAHARLGELEAALEAGSDATARLDALGAAVHASR